ncbi:unnamed protein product, partial [Urochloa humidicola]
LSTPPSIGEATSCPAPHLSFLGPLPHHARCWPAVAALPPPLAWLCRCSPAAQGTRRGPQRRRRASSLRKARSSSRPSRQGAPTGLVMRWGRPSGSCGLGGSSRQPLGRRGGAVAARPAQRRSRGVARPARMRSAGGNGFRQHGGFEGWPFACSPAKSKPLPLPVLISGRVEAPEAGFPHGSRASGAEFAADVLIPGRIYWRRISLELRWRRPWPRSPAPRGWRGLELRVGRLLPLRPCTSSKRRRACPSCRAGAGSLQQRQRSRGGGGGGSSAWWSGSGGTAAAATPAASLPG